MSSSMTVNLEWCVAIVAAFACCLSALIYLNSADRNQPGEPFVLLLKIGSLLVATLASILALVLAAVYS